MSPYLLITILTVIVIAQSTAIVMLWRRSKRVSFGLDEITEDALRELYHLSREEPDVRENDLQRADAQIYFVDAPPEYVPLSEIEIGQAGRIADVGVALAVNDQMVSVGMKPGMEIAAIHADPLGDPVTYRINGNLLSRSRNHHGAIAGHHWPGI